MISNDAINLFDARRHERTRHGPSGKISPTRVQLDALQLSSSTPRQDGHELATSHLASARDALPQQRRGVLFRDHRLITPHHPATTRPPPCEQLKPRPVANGLDEIVSDLGLCRVLRPRRGHQPWELALRRHPAWTSDAQDQGLAGRARVMTHTDLDGEPCLRTTDRPPDVRGSMRTTSPDQA